MKKTIIAVTTGVVALVGLCTYVIVKSGAIR